MNHDTTISLRLPRELDRDVKRFVMRIAARTGIEVSKSEAIRLLIRQALEAMEAPCDVE